MQYTLTQPIPPSPSNLFCLERKWSSIHMTCLRPLVFSSLHSLALRSLLQQLHLLYSQMKLYFNFFVMVANTPTLRWLCNIQQLITNPPKIIYRYSLINFCLPSLTFQLRESKHVRNEQTLAECFNVY